MAKKETIKSFVLRVDAEIMEAIEKWAADELRSVNGQIEFILRQAVAKRKSQAAKEPDDGPQSG